VSALALATAATRGHHCALVAAKRVYRIRFQSEGKLVELYARQVTQGALFGFVEVAQLVWGSRSEVIIDPSEQELRNEFEGVQRIHVPLHAVVRIDEVEKGGTAKVVALPAGGERPAVPFPLYGPGGPGPKPR